MKKSLLTLAALGLVFAVVGSAQALPVDVSYAGANPARSVKIVSPFGSDWLFSSHTLGVCQINIDLGDGNGMQTVNGFCVDLKQNASYKVKQYNLDNLEAAPQDHGSPYSEMGPQKANYIRELWADQFDNIGDSSVNAAAFQLAVWEIIYEDANNGWDAGSGDLYAYWDDSVVDTANSFLSQLDGQGDLETSLAAITCDLGKTKYQDFVISFSGGEKPPVPEPVTMVSALLGLCGLGGYMRKRTVA